MRCHGHRVCRTRHYHEQRYWQFPIGRFNRCLLCPGKYRKRCGRYYGYAAYRYFHSQYRFRHCHGKNPRCGLYPLWRRYRRYESKIQMRSQRRLRFRTSLARRPHQIRHLPDRPPRGAHDRLLRIPVCDQRRGYQTTNRRSTTHQQADWRISAPVPHGVNPQYCGSVDIRTGLTQFLLG